MCGGEVGLGHSLPSPTQSERPSDLTLLEYGIGQALCRVSGLLVKEVRKLSPHAVIKVNKGNINSLARLSTYYPRGTWRTTTSFHSNHGTENPLTCVESYVLCVPAGMSVCAGDCEEKEYICIRTMSYTGCPQQTVG